MKPTEFDKCIICMTRPVGDAEHVIPYCIGGLLKAEILCSDCNHNFGSKLVSSLSESAIIQQSLELLRGDLPHLYERSYQKPTFVGAASDGSRICVVESTRGLKVLSGPGIGNSTIVDSSGALAALRKKLERAGYDERTVAEYEDAFRKCELDQPLQIPTGDIFVTRPMPRLTKQISGKTMPSQLKALIAMEFLALRIGKGIYRDVFAPIRRFILDGYETSCISIEPYIADVEPAPFHVLRLLDKDNTMAVEMRLFRWHVDIVIFNDIEFKGPDLVYLEDLTTRSRFLAPSSTDAKENRWISI